MSDFKAKMQQNPISAGAPPHTPDLLTAFKGPTSKGRGRRGVVRSPKKIPKIDPVYGRRNASCGSSVVCRKSHIKCARLCGRQVYTMSRNYENHHQKNIPKLSYDY